MDQRTEIEKTIKHDGLEKFLLDQGIDQEAIDTSKEEIAQKEKLEYKFYYDDTGKTAENIQIPVSQIKGVSRISGYSWFKLLEYSLLGVPSFIPLDSFNLNRISFLNWVSTLAKTSLQNINEIYQKADTLEFSCYEKNGIKEYYGINDGNHRTITAKIYGLQELPARRVNYYVFNDAKYQEFQLYKKQKKEAEQLLTSLGLFVDELDFIIFKGQDVYIRVAEFPFEEVYRPVSEMIQEMDQVKTMLQRVYKKADLYQKLYQHFPTKLRKIVYYFAENSDSNQLEKRLSKLIALNNLYK